MEEETDGACRPSPGALIVFMTSGRVSRSHVVVGGLQPSPPQPPGERLVLSKPNLVDSPSERVDGLKSRPGLRRSDEAVGGLLALPRDYSHLAKSREVAIGGLLREPEFLE